MHSETAPLPEVRLGPGALFIADLHVDARDEAAAARFADFLSRARGAPRLVILGDLFEAWVGPAHVRLAGARAVHAALRAFADAGAAIDFVPGNRDFLLGRDFERACGARVHPHGFVGLLDGGRMLAIHGDELCTLDRAYQRMKSVLRSAPVTWLAPRLPAPLALAAAQRLRRTSVRAVADKPPAEKAQQPGEVVRLARAHRAETVLCGHAHDFRDEPVAPGVRWIVLDAFGGRRDVLEVDRQGGLDARASLGEGLRRGPA